MRRLGPATSRALLLLPALGAIGCVMPDQLSRLQKDVADVRQQLHQVQRQQDETRQSLAELARQPETAEPATRTDVADLAFRVDQLARESEIADERVSELARRLDRLGTDLAQTRDLARRPVTVGPAGDLSSDGGEPDDGEVQPTLDATDVYNTAYTDFSKGNYALAISGFQEFQQRYPDSPLADNALYWVGECHFSQGDFPGAIVALDDLLERYPDSDKAAAANLKKGLAYLEQNQIRQAIVQLQHVRTAYAGSDEARIARDKLTSLGAPI